MYKIETHLHTTHVSQCGKMTAKEIVDAYKKAGYSALIVTDHYNRTTFNYLGIDPAAKTDRLHPFLDGYMRVKEEAEKQGIRVFRGAELRFDESGNSQIRSCCKGSGSPDSTGASLQKRMHSGNSVLSGRHRDYQHKSTS